MEQADLRQIWQKAVILLSSEISEISLNTWIKPMEPLSANQGVFMLSVPNDFHKTFVDQYVPLIRNTLKAASSREFEIKIVVGNPDSAARLVQESASAEDRDTLGQINHSRLNTQYTFDAFVVGSGNRFAHAACVAVAEKQGGRNFNPLFLYGGSGLGKTHLMHAIGNYVLNKYPAKKILYVQCEQFVNEFIYTIKENKYDDFRSKYRNTDMLLIDDIQFIEGKEQMQIEFFHTFNTLYESGKNIVMTCDKPPQSLISLEERLRTRFSCGLTVDIQPPDYETRVAILKRRAQINHTSVPDDVFDFIAANIASNIRELEGAFNTVLCYSLLAGSITIDVAREALKDIIQPIAGKKVSSAVIMDIVSRYYHVTVDDLKSNRRSKEVTNPRQVAMYLCRVLLNMTLPQIGSEFGNRDHTTVMHSCNKVNEEINKQGELVKDIEEIKKRIAS
ncbi:MAG: chromosomal replication initiator protein DnaA [Clostridiaceae bacterium]|nr:chromosomal replication initiator protein DnaA [Clostridiaceae bacterium]